MPVLNYSTSIEASRSVTEIHIMLGRAGANRVLVNFEHGEPVALIFELEHNTYLLPCRTEQVYKLIVTNPSVPKGLRTHKQALRIAWRILKDWTAAQIAIIQTNMVSADEVFMPYMIVRTDSKETMYDVYKENQKQLEEKP